MPSPISSYIGAYQANAYKPQPKLDSSVDAGVKQGQGESKSASQGITYNLREAVSAINEEHGTKLDVDVNRRGDAAGLILNLLV